MFVCVHKVYIDIQYKRNGPVRKQTIPKQVSAEFVCQIQTGTVGKYDAEQQASVFRR